MSRNRRTHILIDGDRALSQQICAHIEELFTITLVSGPREVLVMNKVRESAKNSLFYLGEALLTECKVKLETKVNSKTNKDTNGGDKNEESVVGIGLVLGENRDHAYELAVIDAAFSLARPSSLHKQWVELLEQEEERLEILRQKGQDILETTRVEFNSMLTEEDDKGVIR